ncbi:hypothetical protein J4N45_21240 [Vibrio sp. SCSIO 43140]|uniref:Uncharacterized protein n=1 Tax=Vibrio variabilis TaxID=990271 RepID=A0ABQ0JRD8_9VIBR|nr:hypothetical protein [Vibrio sp. SCSIO 43140]USD63507.1 hypothetical protein J4N45_21240 [Vibrio sp. SCSIO 43140]GAL31315.1 hypothetical protein JCM19239_6534 [Vibrio variabilis]
MEFVCGTCRQFQRKRDNEKDLCTAWGNPTSMKREGCQFWMPKSGALFAGLSDEKEPKE